MKRVGKGRHEPRLIKVCVVGGEVASKTEALGLGSFSCLFELVAQHRTYDYLLLGDWTAAPDTQPATSQKLLVLKNRNYVQFYCDIIFVFGNNVSRSKHYVMLLRRFQTHNWRRRVRQKTFVGTFALIGGSQAVRSNDSRGYTSLV